MTPCPSYPRAFRAFALALPALLLLVGCAAQPEQSDANSDSERQAWATRGFEACFTNSLSEPIDLATTADGSSLRWEQAGTRWEQTLRPAATLCTRTPHTFMSGSVSPHSEPNGYSYRFSNPQAGYPAASIIQGLQTQNKIGGPGLCTGFKVSETQVYDSGTARFTVLRLEDSADFKHFTVTISPSEQLLVPNSGSCLYGPS